MKGYREPETMSENDLLAGVLDLARVLGWRTIHVRPGRTLQGWRTSVSGDGKGWPDVFAVQPRSGRIVAAELKAELGRLTDEQGAWLSDLTACGVETFVWRPSDYPEAIAEALR